jgi:hypothetical protein
VPTYYLVDEEWEVNEYLSCFFPAFQKLVDYEGGALIDVSSVLPYVPTHFIDLEHFKRVQR